MSVEYITELWPGRDASDDIRKHATLNRVFEVRTTDPNDDATVAGGDSSGAPRLGDPHPNYPDAFVVKVNIQQRSEDPTLWNIVIDYDTELPTRAGGGGNSIGGAGGQGAESSGHDASGNPTEKPNPQERELDPRDRPGIWTTDGVELERPFEFAYDDANEATIPVVNSAGLPYNPPWMTYEDVAVFGLNKNVAVSAVSFDTITTYKGTVNVSAWRGLAAGKVMLKTFRKQARYENGIAYLECFLEFHYKRRGWRRYLIDRGYRELISEFGSEFWKTITDKFGNALAEPALLDGAGRELAEGEPAVVYPSDGYREFPTSDFDALMTLLGE